MDRTRVGEDEERTKSLEGGKEEEEFWKRREDFGECCEGRAVVVFKNPSTSGAYHSLGTRY